MSGLFDESLRIGEDTEFCLRVAEKWRFCHVPGAFTFKRRHVGQLSWRLDALLPNAALGNATFFLTPSGAQITCGPPNGAAPREGQCRLCVKGEWRKALRHTSRRSTLRRATGVPGPTWCFCSAVLSCGPVYEGLKRPWHAAAAVVASQPDHGS